jgi:1-aminocyclopropane-1-carboxylate deaminase
VAAHAGLKCVLVQESWVDWPDVTYDRVGNILLSRLMGADVRLVKAGFGIGFKESWEQALAEIEAAGGKPYAIPAGASDHPLGGLGFASWAREVEAQERDLGVFFDTIIVCAVTGSTQAGMIAGFADRDRERRVIGIDASAKPAETHAQVARIARFTAKAIGLDRDLRDDEIILDDRYHAGIYGIPDEATLGAMRLVARLEGMITDPVYEGKSMAGLIDLVERREIPATSTVLYAHLGGQPPSTRTHPSSARQRAHKIDNLDHHFMRAFIPRKVGSVMNRHIPLGPIILLAIALVLTACGVTVSTTFENIGGTLSSIVPSAAATPESPTASAGVSVLEGRWATAPTPIADIKASMIAAGIAAADVDAWVIQVGSPSQFSFVLEFTGNAFRHSEETPDMPMQVGESGTFTLSETQLVLTIGEPGNIDTYTLAPSLSLGDDLSLEWVASTEEGTAGDKETHRRFTIAFYCSAVFKRVAE